MRYPSFKTLRELTDTDEEAILLRKIIDGTIQPFAEYWFQGLSEELRKAFPNTHDYIRSCYHCPDLWIVRLYLANELLHTYGVEYIQGKGTAKTPTIEYCNTGHTYALTLMLLNNHRWAVGCWGDIVEKGNYA